MRVGCVCLRAAQPILVRLRVCYVVAPALDPPQPTGVPTGKEIMMSDQVMTQAEWDYSHGKLAQEHCGVALEIEVLRSAAG